jgi:hypothetical protein
LVPTCTQHHEQKPKQTKKKRAFSKTKNLSSKRVNFTRAKERDGDGDRDRETYKMYKAQRSRSISTQLTFDD